jgi:hypothetical protein
MNWLVKQVQIEKFFDQLNEVSIYPNPVFQELTIERKKPNEMVAFSIYDLTGRNVYASELPPEYKTVLDLSYLKKGVYFLQIKTSRGTSSSILIKE